MAIPLYLWLKDEDGTLVKGSSQVTGRLGSIEVLSFSHGLHIPIDGSTGKLLGTRSHFPLLIEKEIDKSSPYLYMAIAKEKTLQTAEIKWYRINNAGHEEEYFNILMTNVKVVSACPRVPNIKEQPSSHLNHYETIEFRYEEIKWSYLDGNVAFKDSWNFI